MRAPSLSVSSRLSDLVRLARLPQIAAALLVGVLGAAAPCAWAQPPWTAEIRAVLSQPAPVSKAVRAKQRRQARRMALRARKAAQRQAIRDARHTRQGRPGGTAKRPGRPPAHLVSSPTIR